MNKLLIAAALSASTFGAMAQTASPSAPQCSMPSHRMTMSTGAADPHARASLYPAGEAIYPYEDRFVSQRTLSDLGAEVVAARGAGTLMPAGEASEAIRQYPGFVSTRTRAQLRNEVAMARANGELIPAGEAAELANGKSTFAGLAGSTRVANRSVSCMG